MRGLLLSVLLLLCGVIVMAQPFEQTITLQDYLGYAWESDIVHQHIAVDEPGKLFPDRVALFDGKTQARCQLAKVTLYPEGSIRTADVWFRTDLPAKGTRTFQLRAVKANAPADALKLERQGNTYELRNGLTAVRVPAGNWTARAIAPADVAKALSAYLRLPAVEGRLPGPLLGVKLPSGKWTAASGIVPSATLPNEPEAGLFQPVDRTQPAGACLGYTSEVTAQGPVFITVRVTYRFANNGQYVTDVTLRAGEPLVRLDEQYDSAGALQVELGENFAPTAALYESYRPSPEGRTLPINHDKPNVVGLFVGWDFFFNNISPAFMFAGDPGGDMLAMVSTDADWLPFPYNQGLRVLAAPGKLTAAGLLDKGKRHWGLLVGKSTDDPKTGRDLFRWWNQHLVVSLDKVTNWQLEWPGMEKQVYPHTFFSKEELPAMRARWQDDPLVKDFMSKLNLGGGANVQSDAAAAYLITGEAKYLKVIKEAPTQGNYIDGFIEAHRTGCGVMEANGFDFMSSTDALLQRLVGFELLLGSDMLTPQERKELQTKLAFIVYVMHDQTWWPPNYPFEPTKDVTYPAYVQGTPNQKHCYYSVRAMTACLLGNHPMLPKWIDFALEENERVMPGSVAENGVYVESAFYSSRDTMRFGPFWTAMTRAGAQGPNVDKWLRREKLCFQYLSDLLTPPDPRFGGRRVYHALGRSSSGVVDQAFMIAPMPFGKDDETYVRRMRWCWEAEGKPAINLNGTTGGRDTSLTLLAYDKLSQVAPSDKPPLTDVRWPGFGVIFRGNVDSNYESNVVFRHGPFSWDMYEGNNGGVYFYAKGAPLLPRFGGYWNGNPNLMSIPFGNRMQFAGVKNPDWTDCVGDVTDYSALDNLAGYTAGVTRDTYWRRGVLFAKDLDRDDPCYLLVRDDVTRANVPTALHWWVLAKAVQPNGITSQGVVPAKGYSDDQWIANMGSNWKDAPKLSGQLQYFEGQCGVDLDMFIAAPSTPILTTDAAGVGPGLAYSTNMQYIEYQQLVRIEQPAGKPFLTLLTPRLPGTEAPQYRTIADGAGVAIARKDGEDRLFFADRKVAYQDDVVTFDGHAGFARRGGSVPLRLMVVDGRISADGVTLTCVQPAALLYDGKTITVRCAKAVQPVVELAPALKGVKVEIVTSDK